MRQFRSNRSFPARRAFGFCAMSGLPTRCRPEPLRERIRSERQRTAFASNAHAGACRGLVYPQRPAIGRPQPLRCARPARDRGRAAPPESRAPGRPFDTLHLNSGAGIRITNTGPMHYRQTNPRPGASRESPSPPVVRNRSHARRRPPTESARGEFTLQDRAHRPSDARKPLVRSDARLSLHRRRQSLSHRAAVRRPHRQRIESGRPRPPRSASTGSAPPIRIRI